MGTSTANFGAGKRESHDATAFYDRFVAPELSDDAHIGDSSAIPSGCVLGDARDMAELPDSSVALVVTSPPYFAGKAYEQELGQGHVPGSYLEFLAMLRDVFAECRRVLEPGGRIAVNVANLGRKPYRSLAADVIGILQDDLGLLLRGEIVWLKAEGASGSCAWGSFRSPANPVLRDVSERIVVASKARFDRAVGGAARRSSGRPSVATATNDEFLDATLDVWRIAPESARRVNHPAPFPVELPERLIHLYTYEGDVVLDPFCGAGSALVAAARTGRRGVGYDTEPEYVAITAARLAGPEALPQPAADRFATARSGGRSMSGLAEAALTDAGFTVEGRGVRVRGTGMAVDFVVAGADGRRRHVDVSGAFTVTPNGLARTDNVWRALGRAAVLRERGLGPLLLLTSHLPAPGSDADAALRAATPGLVSDALEVGTEAATARLAALAAGPPAA